MPRSQLETLTMYDIDSGEFCKPDDSINYSPSDNFIVNNWNTWMRAFVYWMRDYFGFQVSRGPGTSMGQIGWRTARTLSAVSRPYHSIPGIGYDNDWTSESNHGVYPIETDQIRESSPFEPTEENGIHYYSDDNSEWNATWGNNYDLGFDDKNNRFDIIITNNEYDKLGLRFKYPITTTGFKRQSVGAYEASTDGSFLNLTFPVPGFAPTLNQNLIARNNNTTVTESMSWYYLNSTGFITFLNKGIENFYIMQSQTTPGANYTRTNLSNKYLGFYQGWTPSLLNQIDSSLKFSAFKQYNKIEFLKYDDKVILISITDGDNILTQFSFYKNTDNTSGLLIAEDLKRNKNESFSWINYKGNKYGILGTRAYVNGAQHFYGASYGNLGNIIVDSQNNFKVTPLKYFKDIRGTKTEIVNYNNLSFNVMVIEEIQSGSSNLPIQIGYLPNYCTPINANLSLNLISPDGSWELKNFVDTLGHSADSLFLVTKAGTEDLTNKEGRIIKTEINNEIVKLLVIPFNGAKNEEYNTEDNSYLIAIPIEQEE